MVSRRLAFVVATVALALGSYGGTKAPPELVGEWIVVAYGGADEPAVPFWEPRAIIEFKSDGKLAGHTGCNRFDGGFKVEEGRVVFERVDITLSGCPNEAMVVQEKVFYRIFEDSPVLAVEGERATLTAPGTSTVLVIRRR
jgi:heat shock protein HslJ